MCMPQVQEGDEIIHINGRTVKDLPHREVCNLCLTFFNHKKIASGIF